MQNHLMEVNLENIKHLDARINAAFDSHLRTCVKDCFDRPGDKSKRKVKIVVELEPSTREDGTFDYIDHNWQFSSVVPPHRTGAIQSQARTNGSLAFNPHSLDDVNQLTLDQEINKDKKEDNEES